MSFERSVIIPYSKYLKCKIDGDKDALVDILADDTIPSDKKLKLFNQSTTTTKKTPTDDNEAAVVVVPRGQHILHNIPDKHKPVVKSILDIIHANKSVTDYNDNLEVIVNGKTIFGSNLINILLYLTNNTTVTSKADIPIGVDELYDALLEVGMPSVWISSPARRGKRKVRQSERLAERKKKQRLTSPSATKWTSFATTSS